jgi:hypothetical protein
VHVLERAYVCVSGVHGPVHPEVQKITNDLIEALRAQGDTERAQYYAKVNFDNLVEFDADQVIRAEGAYTLASLYKDTERLQEAGDLYKQCLATFEATCG